MKNSAFLRHFCPGDQKIRLIEWIWLFSLKLFKNWNTVWFFKTSCKLSTITKQHKHLVRVWVIFQNGYCHFSFGGMRCVAKWENIPNYIYYSWERMPGKRRLTDSTNCVPTYFGVKLAQNIWNVITPFATFEITNILFN